MIESLFGYNLQNSIKNEEVKTKTSSPSKHVLEPKRLQNITILSKALNVTAEQVCQALMQGNLEKVSQFIYLKEIEQVPVSFIMRMRWTYINQYSTGSIAVEMSRIWNTVGI